MQMNKPIAVTQQTLTIVEANKLPKNLMSDVLYVDSQILPFGEIMPGEILFNAPAHYIPIRAFVTCKSDLTDFVIQDSEQTELFVASKLYAGTSCLNLKNGICPPFLPTLNLSCKRNEDIGIRIVIEYHKSPFFNE